MEKVLFAMPAPVNFELITSFINEAVFGVRAVIIARKATDKEKQEMLRIEKELLHLIEDNKVQSELDIIRYLKKIHLSL